MPVPAVFAALLLMGTTPGALAQAQAPAPVPSQKAVAPRSVEQARRLIALADPPAWVVASNFKAWEAALRRGMALQANVAKLETAYPGITEAAIAAARPIARAYCEDFATRVEAREIDLYTQSLTQQELDEVVRFFETPAAQRMVKGMRENTNADALIDQVAKQAVTTGAFEITKDQTNQIDRAAGVKTVREASAEDQIAMMRFSASVAGQKYGAARRVAMAGLLEIANHPDPDFMRRQGEAIQSGILAFVDAHKK